VPTNGLIDLLLDMRTAAERERILVSV